MFDNSVSPRDPSVQEDSWTLPKTMQEITASRWSCQVRQVRHFSRNVSGPVIGKKRGGMESTADDS
jgi:hypothetical protein